MNESTMCRWRQVPAAIATCVVLALSVAQAGHGQQVASTPRTSDGKDALLTRIVTMTFNHVPLAEAIDSVSRLSGVPIQYRVQALGPSRLVSVHAVREPLGEILEHVLDGTSVRAVSDGKGHISLVSIGDDVVRDSISQTGVVSGRVVDSATGRGISGATVKVAGMKISTVTADSGRFVLKSVPVGDQLLTIRSFGYRPAERSVRLDAQQTETIRVGLVATPNVLSGVVTTATGERDRRTIGNDVTVINADSVLKVAPVRTVTDLLETRVPGLTVTHTSGVPGAPARLRLHGVGGLVAGATDANDPVVIVDGMRIYARTSTARDQNLAAGGAYTTQSGLDQLDVNSIETVEVFKGPSASSLYGPDAASGVIVITTKRGRAGPVQWSTVFDVGVSHLPGVYAGPGYYQFAHFASRAPGSFLLPGLGLSLYNDVSGLVIDSTVTFQALASPRLAAFGTGTDQKTTLTVSGGSSTLTYALTGSTQRTLGDFKMPDFYRDQYQKIYDTPTPGWMKRPNLYDIWQGSGSFSATITPGLIVRYVPLLSVSHQRQSSAQLELSTLASTYIDTIGAAPILNQVGQFATRVTSDLTTQSHSLGADWTRWQRFPLHADASISGSDGENVSYTPFGINSTHSGEPNAGILTGLGQYSYFRPTTQTYSGNLNGTLHAARRLPIGLGINVQAVNIRDFSGSVDRLSAGVTEPSALNVGTHMTATTRSGGWFVEPRLTLSDRLYFSPGFRIDNQNGLARNSGVNQTPLANPFEVFSRPQRLITNPGGFLHDIARLLVPKADLSFIALDRQNGAPLWGFVSFVRPHFAFGTSTVQPDPTQNSRIYTAATFDSTNNLYPYPGWQLTTIGNPSLKPERRREVSVGNDLWLWQQRVQLGVNVSRLQTYDAIVVFPLAPSAGGSTLTQYRNLGLVRNDNVDLELNVTPIQRASVSWTVGGSYTAKRNTIVRLNGNGTVVDLGDGTRYVQGYPIGGRWERPIIGYADPGVDASGRRNKLGIQDLYVADSAQYVGTGEPRYTLPMHSTLTLFGGTLGFNVDLEYEHGRTQYNNGSLQLLSNLYLDSTSSLSQQAAALSAWCEVTNGVEPLGFGQGIRGCRDVATLYGVVQTVNTLRLHSLSMNYLIPSRLSRRLRLPRVSVAVQGMNVGLWTNYRGKDPDVNSTPVGESVSDNGAIPLPRQWQLSIRIGN